jgi:N-acyl-phosphatidylethanolamine-hydrolysing phospholipase D
VTLDGTSHRRPDGRFHNPWPDSEPQPFAALLKWNAERLRHGRPKDPAPSTFPLRQPTFRSPRAGDGMLTVTWVGHSTVLLQLGGLNVLTDPIWSSRASPLPFAGPRRWVPPGVALEALPPIDAVLLSHNHYDHFDVPTIRALARRHPGAAWCVPLGLSGAVRSRGARDVREFDWWESATLSLPAGVLEVGCTPAQHFSARATWDRNTTLWCGFAIRANGRRVFFAADTGHHPEFARIGERFGPFDVALMPVGAYEPRWFMRVVHMTPEEALCALDELRQGSGAVDVPLLVPIHWGTFKLTDEALDEPPRRTRAEWVRRGWPRERLWQLAHGETRVVGATSEEGTQR